MEVGDGGEFETEEPVGLGVVLEAEGIGGMVLIDVELGEGRV